MESAKSENPIELGPSGYAYSKGNDRLRHIPHRRARLKEEKGNWDRSALRDGRLGEEHTVDDQVGEAVDSVEDDTAYPGIPQSVPQCHQSNNPRLIPPIPNNSIPLPAP